MANMAARNMNRKTKIVPFIKQEAKKLDIPGLSVPAEYNESTGDFDPPEPLLEKSEAKNDLENLQGHEDLKRALLDYQRLNLKPALALNVDQCSWEDVFAQMSDANIKYEEKAKGIKGTFRKLWKKMGQHAEMAENFLDFIPDEYGLGTVRAGLSLCFQFAKQSLDKADSILTAFEEIPDTIIRAQEMRKNFPDDKSFETNAMNLYKTLLGAIADLIGCLLHQSEASKVPFFLRRKSQKPNLEEVLNKVKTEGDALKRYTTSLWESLLADLRRFAYENETRGEVILDTVMTSQTTLDKTKTQVSKVHRQGMKTYAAVQGIEQATKQSSDNIRRNYRVSKDIKVETHEILEKVGDLTAQFRSLSKRKTEAANAANIEGTQALNALIQHLEETLKTMQAQAHGSSPSPQQSSVAMITLEELISFLKLPTDHAVQDLELMLRQAPSCPPTSLAQAHSLLRTTQFASWSRPSHPSLLLVNANLTPTGSERWTAISIFSASFIASLEKASKDAISLSFFCGLHTSSFDPLRGPGTIVRSFVMQIVGELVNRLRLSFDFVKGRSFRLALQRLDRRALWGAFAYLLDQLPMHTPVFCFVDGISWYEEPGYREELRYVVMELQRLVFENDGLRPVLKVLVTSERESRYLEDVVSRERCVNLRPEWREGDVLSERMMVDETERLQGDRYENEERRRFRYPSDDDDAPEDYT